MLYSFLSFFFLTVPCGTNTSDPPHRIHVVMGSIDTKLRFPCWLLLLVTLIPAYTAFTVTMPSRVVTSRCCASRGASKMLLSAFMNNGKNKKQVDEQQQQQVKQLCTVHDFIQTNSTT